MAIKFEKWQGLGNDFIILQDDIATSDLAIKMCERNFGIGADGLFCPTKSDVADISWKFFNSDGTVAQMCGNGIRCLAQYAKNNNLVNNNKFTIETLKGIINVEVLENNNVLVDMGEPIFNAESIPVNVDTPNNFIVQGFDATAVSMGNPHCVIFCEEDAKIQAHAFGKSIENDPYFPQKTNVEFINIISSNRIKMHVWERGCGLTLACGTGACAAVVVGVRKMLINRICDVILPGGVLNIEYKENNHVYMRGEAKKVFCGEFEI